MNKEQILHSKPIMSDTTGKKLYVTLVSAGEAMEEYANEWRTKADQAENLLERIIMDHALGIEMNGELYREIKTFLDGSK